MSEFRQNLATKEWVILSTERGKRPKELKREQEAAPVLPEYKDNCPFCVGNEAQTVEPVLVLPENGPWQVRVVPNKFAALNPDSGTTRSQVGAFLSAKGFGMAEVIIEHPKHNLNPALMSLPEVINILKAYRARQQVMNEHENINLITIFRNHGPRAGTSLEHPHSQIIATPIVPPHVRYPIEKAQMHYDNFGVCVYCEMVQEELRQKERILIESENFAAFCPFAARSPFECRIYPKKHQPSFILINDDDIAELASVLREVLARLYHALDNPDYNYIIRSAPVGDHDTRYMHWYMVLIPKVTTPAGFELGSGIFINTISPEDCALHLRELEIPK